MGFHYTGNYASHSYRCILGENVRLEMYRNIEQPQSANMQLGDYKMQINPW